MSTASLVIVIQLVGLRYVSTQFCTPSTSPFSATDLSTYPLVNQSSSRTDSSTPAMVSTSMQAVQDYIVKKHNCLRTLPIPTASNMLTIQWNAEAAKGAQQHANSCVFQHNSNSNRSTSQFSSCGQNIAMNSGRGPMSWKTVIDMWYNEVASCTDGTAKTCSSTAGHYTQIVWAKTWQIGCGWSNCGSFNFFVCNYCPAGNFNGELPYRSGVPCSACPNNCMGGKLCNNPCLYTDAYTNCPSLMSRSAACSASTNRNNCKATCLCGGNNGLTNSTPSSPPTTLPITKPSTSPSTATSTKSTTTVRPSTPPTTTTVAPVTFTPPSNGTKPTGYDLCDTTFCTGKVSKLYEVWPCSRFLCSCNGNTGSMFSCNTGTFFDGSTGMCKANNATWCTVKPPSSTPVPAAWPSAPDNVASMCSTKNCVGRAGTVNNWFGLGICSPYWCMCFSAASQALQTCPAGQFVDVRPESPGCAVSGNLPYC